VARPLAVPAPPPDSQCERASLAWPVPCGVGFGLSRRKMHGRDARALASPRLLRSCPF
jgi:hypothetical protein